MDQINRTFVNVTASQTDNNVIAANANFKIKVVGLVLVCGATATTITFNTKPAGAGTAISASFSLGINGTLVLPQTDKGWFATNLGEGLTATTGAGATVAAHVLYTYDV